jgi:hypothetical protein
MRTSRWLIALVAIMATGLIAAGCGDDDESTTAAAETTSTSEETTSEDTSTSEEATADDVSSTPDDVYHACIEAVEGRPGESAGQAICEQARDGFEQCVSQAEGLSEGTARDLAIRTCQGIADRATEALEGSG